MNKIVFTIAAMIFMMAGIAAYMFRYEPLSSSNPIQAVVLWDRWKQRVCVQTLLNSGKMECTLQGFANQTTEPWKSDPIIK